jgi:hypothetical protein
VVNDDYSFSMPPGETVPREDAAMLLEEAMVQLRYGALRDFGFVPRIPEGGAAADQTLVWGQRGRIGEPALRPRLQLVLAEDLCLRRLRFADELVKENEDIAEVVNAFYSSVHYGSTELRSSTLMAHTRSFNSWLEGRATIRPKEQATTSGAAPPKPDNWQYDPNEPLPADITPERATHLLFALAQWRGTNVAEWRGKDHKIIPVGSADGWQHYINKLKDRAKKRA